MISHAARYLTKEPRREDVLSIYSGLRPLVRSGEGKNTAQLSRDHVVRVSPSGLVTVTGGKWTTYRRIGEDTVNRLVSVAALDKKPSRTATLKLHGWKSPAAEERFAAYGSDAAALVDLLAEQAGWGQLLHPELPYCCGEVIWAARYELARTVEDVLARRTRALLLNARASQEVAPRVAELLANELGMPPDWQQQQANDYILLANGYILDGGDSDGRRQNSERAISHAN